MRRTLLLALCAVTLFGCGGDSAKVKADLGQARSVVTRFSEASDASACDLLTNEALKNLFTHFKGKRSKSLAACAKAAVKFKGAKVKIISSELVDDLTARVVAHSIDKKFTFAVSLRRATPKRPWRIERIGQAKLE